jgi:hypothetical protein
LFMSVSFMNCPLLNCLLKSCLIMYCLLMKCLFMKHPIEHRSTILLFVNIGSKINHTKCQFLSLLWTVPWQIVYWWNVYLLNIPLDTAVLYFQVNIESQIKQTKCLFFKYNMNCPLMNCILMKCPLMNCLLVKRLFMKHPIEHRNTILSSAHWVTNKPNQMSILFLWWNILIELSFDEMSVYETSHRTPQYYSFKWTLSHK